MAITMQKIHFGDNTFESVAEQIRTLPETITSVAFRCVSKWRAPHETIQDIIDLLPPTVSCLDWHQESLEFIAHINHLPESVNELILEKISSPIKVLIAFFKRLKTDMKHISLKSCGLNSLSAPVIASIMNALPTRLDTLDISKNGFETSGLSLKKFRAFTENMPRQLKTLIWQYIDFGEHLTESDVAIIMSGLPSTIETIDITQSRVSVYLYSSDSDTSDSENDVDMACDLQKKSLALIKNMPPQLKNLICSDLGFSRAETTDDTSCFLPNLETLEIIMRDFPDILYAFGEESLASFYTLVTLFGKYLKPDMKRISLKGESLNLLPSSHVAFIMQALPEHLNTLEIGKIDTSEMSRERLCAFIENMPRRLKTLIWQSINFGPHLTNDDIVAIMSCLPTHLETLDIAEFDFSITKNDETPSPRETELIRIFESFKGTMLSTVVLNPTIRTLYPAAFHALQQICNNNEQTHTRCRKTWEMPPLTARLCDYLLAGQTRFFAPMQRLGDRSDYGIETPSSAASSSSGNDSCDLVAPHVIP